ncbi:MAG: STAS/SEC14 domain-containing protein [Gemmatimonadetes bacterium]|nr:STAS/SEC14 domain-containing protein [Gemmatimonadota bacterium]
MKELKAESSTQKLYWDSEEKIVWGELIGNQVTEELAKENIDAQEDVRDGLNRAKIRVLVDMTAITEISKEARDYFANERTASIQRATALLIGSPVSRVIGNFFMGLNKPISPTRLFTDPHKAIQRLQTFSDD